MSAKDSDIHRYDDIIDLPHHVSDRRARMSMSDRAAQFAPFAALTGFGAAITETGRLTDEKAELDEDEKAALNEKLGAIAERIDEQPVVTLTCFQPDKRKAGGAYVTVTDAVKRIDEYERVVIMKALQFVYITENTESYAPRKQHPGDSKGANRGWRQPLSVQHGR